MHLGIKAHYCSGNGFNWILNIFLHFKSHGGYLRIIAFITLPEEQFMHLIKLGIPYSCTSIVAHLWASIAICKNSLKFFAWHENMTVAWDQAHFLYLFKAMLCITLQSILVSYAKIHFQQIYKLPKATKQISQITKKYSSPLNTLPCMILKQGGKKFSCDTGNMIYILIAWLGFLFFPPFCLSLILFIIKTIPLISKLSNRKL